jgi:hypothetical protein
MGHLVTRRRGGSPFNLLGLLHLPKVPAICPAAPGPIALSHTMAPSRRFTHHPFGVD